MNHIDTMRQALEFIEQNNYGGDDSQRIMFALRLAIEQSERQEPRIDYRAECWPESPHYKPKIAPPQRQPEQEPVAKSHGVRFDSALHEHLAAPPQRQPLTDSVREMRDVQGRDGTWNYDPYMHGLYNGLEFAMSLLEQREPQFKDAPEKWLSDLPKPRIVSSAHGIGGEV